jgi:hypothetical protein
MTVEDFEANARPSLTALIYQSETFQEGVERFLAQEHALTAIGSRLNASDGPVPIEDDLNDQAVRADHVEFALIEIGALREIVLELVKRVPPLIGTS